MKLYRLIYNSFITGLVVSIIAFQNEWLEMRMNIGIIIPIFMFVCLAVGIIYKKAGRELNISPVFTIINFIFCFIISMYLLGIKRIQVVPASIVREGIKLTSISFDIMNIVLSFIIFGGLIINFLGGDEFKLKNFFKGAAGKALCVMAVVCVYFFVPPVNSGINHAVAVLKTVDVQAAKEYILSFGIWAPVVSFMLMVLQSIAAPLPAFIITFANAGLFGWVKGAALSWSSAMAGAAVCYYIAKFLGRNVVEKLTSRTALEKVDEFFEAYGKYAVLIARLLPFISFDIVSYGAGLTSMSFWSFFIATGIGQLPATLVYSYIGGMLTGTVKTFVVGLLILFAVSTLIILLKKMWSDKKRLTV